MKIFPSDYFFDTKTESQFRADLVYKTTRAMEMVGWFTIVVLLFFFITNLFAWREEYLLVNVCRLLIIVSILCTIISNRTIGQRKSKQVFFVGILIITLGLMGVFFLLAKSFGTLGEGGPMLYMLAITLAPVLDTREKLVILLSLFLFLIGVHALGVAELIWTIAFYGLGLGFVFFLQQQQDILLRKNYKSELLEREKAQTDKLTGTMNRHGLDDYLSNQLSSLGANQYLHLAMVDVDYFKKFNDGYGHLEGDMVLTIVAKLLSRLPIDRIVRFGGEEFILISVDQSEDPSWITEINGIIEGINIEHKFSSVSPFVTVSAGVVTVQGVTDKEPHDLLRLADQHLYQAKDAGRNKTKVIKA